MSSFFIAMGQGVVADARANLEVFTEALLSCTFIAGISASGTRGGAFHYPAESLDDVSQVLAAWMNALRPAKITLVFAEPNEFGMGTPAYDQMALVNWFRQRYPGTRVRSTTATAACMTIIDNQFYAGTAEGRAYWDSDEGADLAGPGANQHGYQLFDARSQLRSNSPALVQEASTGRRRRRRSRGRCIVM